MDGAGRRLVGLESVGWWGILEGLWVQQSARNGIAVPLKEDEQVYRDGEGGGDRTA